MSDSSKQGKTTLDPSVFLHDQGIHNSALVFHNYGNTVSAFVELTDPYMFLYGKISRATDQFVLAEITQSHNFTVPSSYSELIEMETPSLHKHDFYEVTYVLSGTLHMVIEGDSYFFGENDCCICNKNIRHVERYDRDCEYFLIMLQEDFLKELLENETCNMTKEEERSLHPIFYELMESNEKRKYTADMTKEFVAVRKKTPLESESIIVPFVESAYFTRNCSISEYMVYLINSLLITVTVHHPGWNYIFRYFLCRLLACFENKEIYKFQHYRMKTSGYEDLFIKISLVIESFHGNLKRSELEHRLGYNGDYLTRIIQKYAGMNFVQYAQSFSLKEAEHLLSETTISIGDICIMLGYNNRTHFNKLFKAKYGMPPKEWRKKHHP